MSKQVDDKILAELREDARIPITTLSERVGRSRTAVQARVHKMEQEKRILRYTIDEPGFTKDSDIGAIIQISLKVRNKSEELLSICVQCLR